MGKRRQAVSELSPKTAEEWEKLKEHPGLIVVDVYTEWAGPCDVMKPIIYKIKAKGRLVISFEKKYVIQHTVKVCPIDGIFPFNLLVQIFLLKIN